MEAGCLVVALFDFETSEPGELALKEGDTVEITARIDDNWISGTCNGRSGTFPANFVKPADGTSHVGTGGAGTYHVTAIQDYDSGTDGDLSFHKGEVITVIHEIDENWMQGTVGGRTGMFPTTFVTKEAPQDQHSHSADTNSLNGPKIESAPQQTSELNFDILDNAFQDNSKSKSAPQEKPKAKTRFPFSAEHEGELSFMDGETIYLRKWVNDQWLEGELDGNVGIFPAEFVEVVVDIPEGYVPPEVKTKVKKVSTSSSNSTSVLGTSQADVAVVKPQLLDVAQEKETSSPKGRRAKVTYDFNPETEHDLRAKQGEIVTIVNKPDNDWYEAKNTGGKVGFIPVAYVQLLDKPRTPSYKRPAPKPPGAKSSKKGAAPSIPKSAQEDTNANELLPIDPFDSLAGKSYSSTPKPSGGGGLDDLLCFDPLGGDGDQSLAPMAPMAPTPPTAPVVPVAPTTGDSSAVKDPSLPHAFKQGGSAFRPVSFTGKSGANTATVPPMSAEPAPPPNPTRGNSILDMSPIDKPMSPLLMPMAPLEPVQPASSSEPAAPAAPLEPVQMDATTAPPEQVQASVSGEMSTKPQVTKQESLDSLSKFDILAARPYNPTGSKQIRSVQRPVNRGSHTSALDTSATIQPVAAPPEGSDSVQANTEILTMSQVNQELDNALLEGASPNTSMEASPNNTPGLLTLSQVNSDLDKVLQEDTVPDFNAAFGNDASTDGSANPFSAADEENPLEGNQSAAVGNPFSATTPPADVEPGFANSFNPLQGGFEPLNPAQAIPDPLNPMQTGSAPLNPMPAAFNPAQAVSNPLDPMQSVLDPLDPLQPAFTQTRLPRDESIQSDMSDDPFAQGINFTINSPLGTTSPDEAQSSAFKLPPPPSPGKRPIAPPKPQKFNPKTAVPRPRPRLSVENMEAVLPPPPPSSKKPSLPPKPQVDLFSSEQPLGNSRKHQEQAQFEASVDQIFDTSSWDTDAAKAPPQQPPPVTRGPSLLDQDLGVVSQVLQQQSAQPAAPGQALVGDLLGIGGVVEDTPSPDPEEAAPASAAAEKSKPSRPAPARPAAPAKRKVPPERPTPPRLGPGSRAVNGEGHASEALAKLESRIAEMVEEVDNKKLQKGNLVRECAFVTGEQDKTELQQQIADAELEILDKEKELRKLQEQLAELKPDQVPAPKMTPADFREKVIKELLKTEVDYVRDIKLCQEGFMTVLQENQVQISEILIAVAEEEMDRTGEKKAAKGLELDVLFGNIDQVIEVAEKFLNEMEETTDKPVEEQLVGKVFMDNAKSLHEAYATYCRNHDDASALLERYEENPEVQEYINQGLELVRQSTNCWDLASFLIKPVQRILKYHLLLAELYKYTEEDHQDKETLKLALETMTDVATDINEFKRRKDLVLKYRHRGQEAISDKLGKLNLHSIRKKSQRINQKFTQMTGMATQTIDEEFTQAERKFHTLEKTIKIFTKDVHAYLEQLKEATSVEAIVGTDISDYYANQSNLHEVNKYELVQNHLANKLYKDYTLFVQQRVMSPLNSLLNMFQGPHKLIQKRYDKLLDYDSYINKAEKTKDKERTKAVKDDKEVARKNYEALNIQLKDELPRLCELAMVLFKSCVISFIEAERDHINSTLKKLYPLIELSIVKSSDMSNIMSDFESSHQSASEAMMTYFFVPRTFDRKVEKTDKKSRKPFKEPMIPASKPPSSKAQSDVQRQNVLTRYPVGRVYQVKSNFIAAQPMDISVYKGNVVGIIKEQDPAGGTDRWYVDSGASQGFLPMHILSPCNEGANTGIYSSDDEPNRGGYNDMSSPQYYFAEWPFTASSSNEITLTEGAVVMVIAAQDTEGNSEWWLVEKDGEQGYVPSAYLSKV